MGRLPTSTGSVERLKETIVIKVSNMKKQTNKGYRKPTAKHVQKMENNFASIINGTSDGIVIIANVLKGGIEVAAVPCNFNLKHTAQLINGLVEAEPAVMEAMLALKMAELATLPEVEKKKKAPKSKKK
jgi:hypothetical protein